MSDLNHVAIILDGNRRWAKEHGLSGDSSVYKHGGLAIAPVVEAIYKSGAQCISLWVGSYSNLVNRSKILLKALDHAYEAKFNELADSETIREQQVKIEIIGEWRELLSESCVAAADRAIEATKNFAKRTLVILVGYDGVRERGAAVQKLLQQNSPTPSDILQAEQLLRSNSWTGHLPNVDLIIRTGAWQDPHNSAGFLGFLTTDSQYSFPPVLWPDLTKEMVSEICDDYLSRERRYGK
ncbi:MAG TPA: undecaprenyl diphosphate synthase family protein [Candidatus Saccharimonadales bacterium]|nr:undecaprenyl diphosphate synthase family protein [Candidatus Saccharimonadales bacterium]